MKRRTKVKIRRIGKIVIFGSLGILAIGKLKSCSNKDKNVNYSYSSTIDSDINNIFDFSISGNSSCVTSLKEAMNRGLISNVSIDELKNTIKSNSNINSSIKIYLLNYVDKIYDKFPNFNNAVLNKNISLLDVKKLTRQEMADRKGNNYINAVFNPVEHIFYYVDGSDINEYIDHEISHMVSEVVFEENGETINLQFSDNGYGQGIEEHICTLFTNIVSSNTNSYNENYIYLLNDVIGSNIIFNSFLEGNVYDITNALDMIDPNINSTRLIEYMDQEVANHNSNNSNYIYSMIGEYFVANENNNLNNSDYISYLPTYINNCVDFQTKLSDLGVNNSVINDFKEKRYDMLAETTRACYPSSNRDDTVILRKDENGINAILNNVSGNDLTIYNYEEDENGIDYISYMALKADDPSDGILDLLSGEVVFPDKINNSESGNYYIENEGDEQKRLSVIRK